MHFHHNSESNLYPHDHSSGLVFFPPIKANLHSVVGTEQEQSYSVQYSSQECSDHAIPSVNNDLGDWGEQLREQLFHNFFLPHSEHYIVWPTGRSCTKRMLSTASNWVDAYLCTAFGGFEVAGFLSHTIRFPCGLVV